MRAPTTPRLAICVATLTYSLNAHANCFEPRKNEVICGDKRICVSGKKGAAEGLYDRNSCVPSSPVCKTLSHLADVYVGGDKNTRPEGKDLIEIASAERLANVSRKICEKLGIPLSTKDAPPGTPRPPGGTWCRSNGQRGGAPGSVHRYCRAMDIYVPGLPEKNSRAARQKLANELYAGQKRGINVYPTGRAHVALSNEYFYSHDVYPQTGGAPTKRPRRQHR